MTEHKPVTDAEAEEILRELDSDGPLALPKYTTARLLRDRAVAMEIIEELLGNYVANDTHYEQPYCVHCHSSWDDPQITENRKDENHFDSCIVVKARTLIAAAKGEE